MSLKRPPPIYSHYNIEMITSAADNEPSGSRMTSAITHFFLPLTSPLKTPLLTCCHSTGWRLNKHLKLLTHLRLQLAWMHWSFKSALLEKTDYPRHGITAPLLFSIHSHEWLWLNPRTETEERSWFQERLGHSWRQTRAEWKSKVRGQEKQVRVPRPDAI